MNPFFIASLILPIAFSAAALALMRCRYKKERWPIDIGWRRLEDLKEHEPERLWTVYRIHRAKGEMVLIGLRRPRR